ncbi:MAG TPA: T9SS type A sorting domain-containing protein, partial [Candidatus Kapabacteria bacterium]|nr:T9SS type A sorting domain-containing protein [Candidatus Kapabacteria bacterium]
SLFPNPAATTLTITAHEWIHTIGVTDILGREVLSSTIPSDGNITLDISSLPSGLYFVSDGIARVKFVKE